MTLQYRVMRAVNSSCTRLRSARRRKLVTDTTIDCPHYSIHPSRDHCTLHSNDGRG